MVPLKGETLLTLWRNEQSTDGRHGMGSTSRASLLHGHASDGASMVMVLLV